MNRRTSGGMGVGLVVTFVLSCGFLVGACSSSGGDDPVGESCLKGLYDCLAPGDDCLLASSDSGQVTVTWPNGASVVGSMGLTSFDAFSPSGQLCFNRSLEGDTILLVADGAAYRVVRAADGSTSVTCPNGKVQQHDDDDFPSTAPGIDPGVFTFCRVSGVCSQDGDCASGEVCCSGKCEVGERCPGTCELDEHCGSGNRCCSGYCTSLPSCQVPCAADFQCDDEIYCNGKETCLNGTCQVASPIQCDDGVDCTLDTCDEVLRGCAVETRDELCGQDERCELETGCRQVITCSDDSQCVDANVCTLGTCLGGECSFEPVSGCCHEDGDCDDELMCNGSERCVDHACRAGTEPDCVDLFECTFDYCSFEQDDCVHEPNHYDCADQEVCDQVLGCIPATDCLNDDNEPNDDRLEAYEIVMQQPYYNVMCPEDADWFRFEIDRDEIPLVLLTFDPALGNLQAQVYVDLNPGNPVYTEQGGLMAHSVQEGHIGSEVLIEVYDDTNTFVGDYMVIWMYPE